MASVIYNSCLDDLVRGNINFSTDSFKGMLVTSSYVPDKDAHTKRSSVTNEVTGTGYTAGGAAITVTLTKDLTNDREDLTFSNPSWSSATITARGMVIYKSRGGASTADELVCYIEFNGGTDVTSTGSTFATTISGPFRFQN